jgi:alkanesulfonate monooxygenase SsuD/methylene tetrahydromethanopterin reductase-like flavin-dependent oxidoreductase (luciferase family)
MRAPPARSTAVASGEAARIAVKTTRRKGVAVDIGIGIPNTVLNTPGALLIEWSRRAEARGFVSLATIGRIAYPAHDELIGLTAAAGATERIGLFTNILLAPAFPVAVLAKQTATLASASRGRSRSGQASERDPMTSRL